MTKCSIRYFVLCALSAMKVMTPGFFRLALAPSIARITATASIWPATMPLIASVGTAMRFMSVSMPASLK